MYIAFLTVTPMDEGPSLSEHVKAAIQVISSSGLKYQVTAMGTIIESPDLPSLFRVVQEAVRAVRAKGSQRISVSLRIDCRYDEDATIDSKMTSVM
ncbi:MAG: MTH1187 family thiamine-binding protein [Candidatus Thermoplasmatota archaeon]|nr:MTH1187 family thiamine-binding protein [Candidatus Thermoplasmatota archaeon]